MKVPRPSIEPVYLIKPVFDADGVQISSAIGVDGKEYPDSVPMAPPIGYEPPSTLEALIESVIQRRDFQRLLAAADFETPEEADDFEVDEDLDDRFPETIYEQYFEAKSKRAAAKAAQAEANRTSSADLVSESSRAPKVEKPTDGPVSREQLSSDTLDTRSDVSAKDVQRLSVSETVHTDRKSKKE